MLASGGQLCSDPDGSAELNQFQHHKALRKAGCHAAHPPDLPLCLLLPHWSSMVWELRLLPDTIAARPWHDEGMWDCYDVPHWSGTIPAVPYLV